MNDVTSRQTIAFGHLGITYITTTETAALLNEFGPGRAMDRTVDATAAQKRRACGVYDRIDSQCCDVTQDGLNYRDHVGATQRLY